MPHLLCALLLALGMAVYSQQPAAVADPTAFPEKASIEVLHIPDYTFPGCDDTNCYLLIGPTGQGILIDPAEQLDFITDKKILVDKATGISTVIEAKDLAAYPVLKENVMGPVLVKDPKSGQERLVYDQFRRTGVGADKILQVLTDKHVTLKYIVITHGHLDHFGALTAVQEKTGAQVLMIEDDLRGLNGAKLVKTADKPLVGYPKDTFRIVGLHTPVDRPLKEGDIISLDGMVLQVLHTPGHCPSSLCLRTRQGEKTILFSGDTLLHWGYMLDTFGDRARDEKGNYITNDTGRTNFLDGSGDEALLYRMIHDKLFILPDDTVVYPGHHESTTIGEEKKYSPARFVKD